MSASVSITLENCAKTWPGGSRALQALDLHIPGGEILALLGPSGCGKTTLLRLICGLEQPDAGTRILYGDEDVTALAPEARGVGVVFQSYALFPNMTVADNVGYGLRVRGMAEAARDLATQVGEHRMYHSDAPFHFLPEYVEELRALYADPLTHPERYFLVAATGDEVLDWREMRDRYPGCRQRIVQGGDHGLSDFPRWMPEVLEFALGSPH